MKWRFFLAYSFFVTTVKRKCLNIQFCPSSKCDYSKKSFLLLLSWELLKTKDELMTNRSREKGQILDFIFSNVHINKQTKKTKTKTENNIINKYTETFT